MIPKDTSSILPELLCTTTPLGAGIYVPPDNAAEMIDFSAGVYT